MKSFDSSIKGILVDFIRRRFNYLTFYFWDDDAIVNDSGCISVPYILLLLVR